GEGEVSGRDRVEGAGGEGWPGVGLQEHQGDDQRGTRQPAGGGRVFGTSAAAWARRRKAREADRAAPPRDGALRAVRTPKHGSERAGDADRKSTRLNSSHVKISYAVFCLKKKTRERRTRE